MIFHLNFIAFVRLNKKAYDIIMEYKKKKKAIASFTL